MSDNNDNMQSLEEYIKDLGSDDAEFAQYMDREDLNCISFDDWVLRKRKQEKEAVEMTLGEPLVIPQPSHEELAKSQRAKAIQKYLNRSKFPKATAEHALNRIGQLINELTPINRQWKKVNSAKDVQVVFQTFHKWGFKDYKEFSTAYDGLLELKESLGRQVLNPAYGPGDVINVLRRPKRERDDDSHEGNGMELQEPHDGHVRKSTGHGSTK